MINSNGMQHFNFRSTFIYIIARKDFIYTSFHLTYEAHRQNGISVITQKECKTMVPVTFLCLVGSSIGVHVLQGDRHNLGQASIHHVLIETFEGSLTKALMQREMAKVTAAQKLHLLPAGIKSIHTTCSYNTVFWGRVSIRNLNKKAF